LSSHHSEDVRLAEPIALGGASSSFLLQRKADFRPQAAFGPVRESHGAAMCLDDAAGDGKPEADAAGFGVARGLKPDEGLE
jgi:hypothetical protein